jgi:polyphenol oxidase
MHVWQWQTWQDKPYLTCSLLDSWQHGFFTQHFSPRSPIDLVEVLNDRAQVYRTKQVHGNVVLETHQLSPLGLDRESAAELADADGIVTHQSQQSVWVCSADCTPVLIADDRTGQVAAIHSGWRGTAAGIVPQAIAQLQAQGSQIPDLRVAMGPAIAGCVYQVSAEVALQVGASLLGETQPEETLLDRLVQWPNSPVSQDSEPGKVLLDIRRAIALQVEKLGISAEHVAIAPHCTYQNADDFFSYRRSGQKNVQWSGIVST